MLPENADLFCRYTTRTDKSYMKLQHIHMCHIQILYKKFLYTFFPHNEYPVLSLISDYQEMISAQQNGEEENYYVYKRLSREYCKPSDFGSSLFPGFIV